MEKQDVPVIITGVLEKDPEPYLTRERRVGCALLVRPFQTVCAAGAVCGITGCCAVHIESALVPVVLACPDRGCMVTIPGVFNAASGIVSAVQVFMA